MKREFKSRANDWLAQVTSVSRVDLIGWWESPERRLYNRITIRVVMGS
jgi:hypothetical protein